MTNPKGTWAESALVNYLRENGFPWAERIPRKGSKDEGDVSPLPGKLIVMEVKNQPSKYSNLRTPHAWLDETEVERQHADADFGLLVVKPSGVGRQNVGEWHCWLWTDDVALLMGDVRPKATAGLLRLPVRTTVSSVLTLLRQAGYGDPL